MPVAPVASLREQVGKAAAAAVLGLALATATPDAAFAKDVQPYACVPAYGYRSLPARADASALFITRRGLTPCKTNAAFAKREKAELKTLTKRLAKVRAPTLGLLSPKTLGLLSPKKRLTQCPRFAFRSSRRAARPPWR